jgi:hypothetical protein
MEKFFYVLGVSHRVQGEMNFKDSFYDPDYGTVVRDLIRTENIDFVAEEGGDHTTDAEKITDELLGPGHYLNVSPEHREDHDIGETFNGYMLTSVTGEDFPILRWFLSETEKLERIWVDLLTKRTAGRGLLICGFYHTFSVGAKLLEYGSVEGRTYVPYDKLCIHHKKAPGASCEEEAT